MLGIFFILMVSYLLLFSINKQNLDPLGLIPRFSRLAYLSGGFTLTACLCILVQINEAWLTQSTWVINENIHSQPWLQSLYWDFKSVVTEELLFRGVLLYLLAQYIGNKKAVYVSAILFGIYHWSTMGVLGQPIAMGVIFLGTGLMGLAWAWAFIKSHTIWLPIGLHLGWNMVHNTVFSKGPLGTMLLQSETGQVLTGWLSLVQLFNGMFLTPMILLLLIKYWPEKPKPPA